MFSLLLCVVVTAEAGTQERVLIHPPHGLGLLLAAGGWWWSSQDPVSRHQQEDEDGALSGCRGGPAAGWGLELGTNLREV